MKLANILKEKFNYELEDDRGDFNCRTIGNHDVTFIIDFIDEADANILTFNEDHLNTLDYDQIKYISFVTCEDNYFNCPEIQVFDLQNNKHISNYLYRPGWKYISVDWTDEEKNDHYSELVIGEYKDFTDDDETLTTRLVCHHQMFRCADADEMEYVIPEEVEEVEEQVVIEEEQLMFA